MIAGVDEAGRGCLAGPVVAAAVIFKDPIKGLDDSKALSSSKRAKLFLEITQKSVWSYAVSTVSEISDLNIRQASLLAMQRAVGALSTSPSEVLIDGRDTIEISTVQRAIIGGDRLVPEIMAASIVAKHIRDEMMITLDKLYPHYGFIKHKGYGTKMHLDALGQNGLVLGVHRYTFKPCAYYV